MSADERPPPTPLADVWAELVCKKLGLRALTLVL